MISKNRLFMILLLINNMALINAGDNAEKNSNQIPNKSLFTPEPTINAGEAVIALFYHTGNRIIGPIVEGTLSLIGEGLEYLVSEVSADKNKDLRSHAYAATAAGLVAWETIRVLRGKTIIPGWNRFKNWWYNTPNNKPNNTVIFNNVPTKSN